MPRKRGAAPEVKNDTGKAGERIFKDLEELRQVYLEEAGEDIPVSKITRYQKSKLLSPVEKIDGRECYTGQHLERLKMIEHLRSKYGMPIKDITGIIGVVEMAPGPEPVVEMEAREREVSRREQIIRNASQIFEAKGFNGTTIDDIVQATGIAKGTFYIYFHNKEELLLEVIRKLIDETGEEIEVKLSEETDFYRRLLIIGRQYTELYLKKSELFNVLIGQTVGNPVLAQQLQDIYKLMAVPIVEDLRKGMKAGNIVKIDDVDTVAYCLVGMGQMVAYGLALDPEYQPETAIRTVTILMRRALVEDGVKQEGGKRA